MSILKNKKVWFFSKEHRKKISDALSGKPSNHKGKKQTEAAKQKLRIHCIKTKRLVGKNNPLWKGGVTPENEIIRHSSKYKIWRLSVYERDFFTCQDCKCSGVRLNAHHIKHFAKYPELRFDISNGITLCKGCHKKAHSK